MKDLDMTLEEFKEMFENMEDIFEEDMEKKIGEDYKTQIFYFEDNTYQTLIVKLQGKIFLMPIEVIINDYSPLQYYVMARYARTADDEDLINILEHYELRKKQADVLGEVLEKNKVRMIFIK